MSNHLLVDKVALVTGASRGIGFEIAKQFSDQGAIVYANARKEGSLDLLKESVQNPHKIIPVYFDVRDQSKVKEAIMKINKEQKRLDTLVNNAGIMQDALIGMISHDLMEDHFEVNVYALMHLLQYAAKLMKRKQQGSIINMASIVGVKGNVGQLVYSATKGAVITTTKTASKELAPSNIRVNAIAPGVIATDMFNSVEQEKRQKLIDNVGMGRVGTPSDIAGTAVFLASDLSAYVTGQIIEVEGSLLI